MANRQIGLAETYVTPQMEQVLANKSWSLQAMSDDYVSMISDNQATYAVGKPRFGTPDNPGGAEVTVSMKYATRGVGRDVIIQLVKDGRTWRVNNVI